HDRAGLARVSLHPGPGELYRLLLAFLVLADQADVVLDLDAVLVDRYAGRLGDLAVLALRCGELDVVALPDGRGLAGVDQGLGNLVDGTAIVILAVQAVAVEH